jgi:hypothetical protein
MGSLDTTVVSPQLTYVASVGQTANIIAAVNWSNLVATNVQVWVQFSDASGATLVRVTSTWTVADIGWVIKSASLVAPANTAWANIQLQVNGYTSGDCYIGIALGTVNGVPITTNWDFADGTTGWTGVNPGVITYDPYNAYMGNALHGGSGNTFVMQRTGTDSFPQMDFNFPCIPGEILNLEAYYLTLQAGTNPIRPFMIFVNNAGGGFGSVNQTLPTNVATWTKYTQQITVPSGAVGGRMAFEIQQQDGVWLVGSVSVSKVTTDKAYIGGIGAGESVALDPPESFWDETFDDRSIVSESQTGHVLQEYVEPLRNYDFNIPTINRDDLRALQAIYLTYGVGSILWIDPETDDLPVMYGRMVEALSASKNKRLYTAKLKFKEAR